MIICGNVKLENAIFLSDTNDIRSVVKKKVRKIKVRIDDGKQPYRFNMCRLFIEAKKFKVKVRVNLKPFIKKVSPAVKFVKRNKISVTIVFMIVVASLLGWLSQTWLVKSSFSRTSTYPNVTVLGYNLGNMDVDQLDDNLRGLETEFETKKINLVNGESKWLYDSKKLGVKLDPKATAELIWSLNKLSIADKYELLIGKISSNVEPVILVDQDLCVESMSAISIPEILSADASFYYDNGLKIKSDQTGTTFNPVSTCKELAEQLAKNMFDVQVSFDSKPAGVTKADLDSVQARLNSQVGSFLTLKSGNYQLVLSPEQLLGMIEIVKTDSAVSFNWSSDKLDSVVNDIAENVDTYNGSPSLGSCQYVISNGGNWLDKAATKNIFKDLNESSPRSYNLSVVYHKPQIGTINPVAHGNSGTIYLTFDDGMTYGDQIMNYAACYGVKVTFFEIGERVAGDAAGLRRAIAEGHTVQSHGHNHALYDYGRRSYDWQYNDMRQSIIDIQSVTGVRPTYFRPPGGNRSSSTYDAASANGLNLVLWGVSSGDGANISTSLTCSNVLSRAFDGATVLLHSTHQSTASAVPCIIEGLAARGYNMQALR